MRSIFNMLGLRGCLVVAVCCAVGAVLVSCGQSEENSLPVPIRETRETAVRVRVFPASAEALNDRVELTGVAAPLRKATVAAEVPGRITGRRVEVGKKVKKGAILYRIDGERIRIDLQQATVSKTARSTDMAFAETEMKRAEELVASRAAPEQALDQARYNMDRARDGLALAKAAEARANKALRDTKVRSPFAGRVSRYFAEEGDYVGPGAPLVTIVDLSQVRVTVGVTAKAAGRIEPGKIARVFFESLGGLERQARIASVAPALDPQNGTYPVELMVDNSDAEILSGMVVRIAFGFDSSSELVVPREAIVRIGGEPHLFAVQTKDDDKVALLRRVRLGTMSTGMVEVVSGIEEGDLVVMEGQFALRDGDRVSVENAVQARKGVE
jgi:membrane fusion protein (multidrug efflux system)